MSVFKGVPISWPIPESPVGLVLYSGALNAVLKRGDVK